MDGIGSFTGILQRLGREIHHRRLLHGHVAGHTAIRAALCTALHIVEFDAVLIAVDLQQVEHIPDVQFLVTSNDKFAAFLLNVLHTGHQQSFRAVVNKGIACLQVPELLGGFFNGIHIAVGVLRDNVFIGCHRVIVQHCDIGLYHTKVRVIPLVQIDHKFRVKVAGLGFLQVRHFLGKQGADISIAQGAVLFRVQQKYLEHKILGQRAGERDLRHGLFRLLHLYGAAGQQLLAVGAVNAYHKVCRTGGKIAHCGGLSRYARIDHPVVLGIATAVFCVRVCVRHSRQQQGAQAVGGGHAQLVAGRGLRKLAGLLLRHCSSEMRALACTV